MLSPGQMNLTKHHRATNISRPGWKSREIERKAWTFRELGTLEHSHIMYGEKSLSKNSEIRSIPTLYFVRKSVIDKYCSKDPDFPYSDPY